MGKSRKLSPQETVRRNLQRRHWSAVVKADEAMQVLTDIYVNAAAECIQPIIKITNKTAYETAQAIAKNSPIGSTGRYQKGWTYKRGVYESKISEIAAYVHNKNSYQLTHLLENDHPAGVDYHLVKGRPHIKPNEEKYKAIYVQRVYDVIKAYLGE